MKNTLSLIALLFIYCSLNAQTFEWAKTGTGPGLTYRTSIVQDDAGYLYTTGYSSDSLFFDNGFIEKGFFIAKYDSLSNLIWLKAIPASNAGTIAIDVNNNIYIAAPFSNGVQVGNFSFAGAGTLIAKLDTAGNAIWAKAGGVASSPFISCDSQGNINLTGWFYQTIYFDSFTLLTINFNSTLFLCRFDTNGTALWLKKTDLGTDASSSPGAIVTDNNNDIIVTGSFKDSVYFDSTLLFANQNNGYDDFLCKYDAGGNLLWVISIGGLDNESGTGLTVDAGNNIYQALYTHDLNNNISQRLIKYNSAGNAQWTQSINGVDIKSVKTNNNDVFIAGNSQFTDSVFFGTTLITNYPLNRMMFFAKYTNSGNFIGVKTGFSTALGGFCCETFDDFVVDNGGNTVYLSGSYTNNLLLDTITPTGNLYSFFITKLQGQLTGFNEINLNKDNALGLFPNPGSGIVTLTSTHAIQVFTVIDMYGKSIVEVENSGSNNLKANIDVSDFSSGIYLVRVLCDNEWQTIKLVVR